MQIFLTQNEINKINLNLDFETSLEVYEIKEVTIIDDIYSLDKEIEFTKKEFEAELETESIESTVSIAESFLAEDISKIIDAKATVKVLSKERLNGYSNYNE